MILLGALGLGILVAYLQGGRFSNLNRLEFKQPYLAFIAIFIQILLFSFNFPEDSLIVKGQPYLYIFSFLPLFIFIWLNRQIPGMKIIATGILSNFLVIVANGGYMPSHPAALSAAGITEVAESGSYHNSVIAGNQTPLWFLSDIFYLPSYIPFANVFSIGDVIIAAGAFVLIRQAMLLTSKPSA